MKEDELVKRDAETEQGGPGNLSRRNMLTAMGLSGVALASGMLLSKSALAGAALEEGESESNGSSSGKKKGVAVSSIANLQSLTIADMRTLPAPSPGDVFYITDPGQEGHFHYDETDTTSTDNTGTVLVSTSGARFQRDFQKIVNAKWFGAKGDGATDDTSALQIALNYAGNSGFVLHLPAGTYLISMPLTMNVRTEIRGDARSNTTISTGSSAIEHLILNGTGSPFLQQARVEQLRFIGANGLGIRTRYTEFLTIANCLFSGTVNGLVMCEGANEQDIKPTLIHNVFYGCQYGILFGNTRLADTNIAFNYFVNCKKRAISIGYMDGGSIVHNKIFSDPNSTTENDGIYIGKMIYAKLESNDIFEVNGYGLYLPAPRRSTISNNTIINTGKTAQKPAIKITEFIHNGTQVIRGDYNEISFNKIHDCYGSGMDISHLDYTDIIGNKIVNAGRFATTLTADGIMLNNTNSVTLMDNLVKGDSITRYWLHATAAIATFLHNNSAVNCVNATLFNAGSGTTFQVEQANQIRSVSATGPVQFEDDILLANASAGAVTIQLPSIGYIKGKRVVVKKTDSTANSVTVTPYSGNLIDGSASVSLTTPNETLRLISNGGDWVVI